MKSVHEVLSLLVSISAPSGYEIPIISFLKSQVSAFPNLLIEEDVLGNLIVKKKGTSNRTIMLVAHCDEIGLTVKYIDEQGFISFTPIGGVDATLLKGKVVEIRHGVKSVKGVIGARPIHMSRTAKEIKNIDFSDLWIDIGAKNKEDAINLVSIGDPISFEVNYTELSNDLVVSKGLDNRSGVAVLLHIMKSIYDVNLDNNIVFVFSVQEELGLRGVITAGYYVNPDIAIVIDVTHATDYPTINRNIYGDIHLGDGPVIPIGANFSMQIQNKLKSIAEKKGIPYQLDAIPGYSGTDAAELQLQRGGCLSGLVSIPCRYMHTPTEIISSNDIAFTAAILLDFIKD